MVLATSSPSRATPTAEALTLRRRPAYTSARLLSETRDSDIVGGSRMKGERMPAQEVDLKLVNGRVVTGDGVFDAGVAIRDGVIVAVATDELLPPARRVIDVQRNHILPGIVDSEAHPGCYVPFEYDLEPESRAAACAGVTTWGIQAPSTRLGTRPFKEFVQAADVAPFSRSFRTAREMIERFSSVDCFLTFMMETDAQAEEIPLYCEEYGVTSYKLYMQARRIPAEDHNWPSRRAGLGVGIDDGTLYLIMEQVARYGAPAICSIHPENWEVARVFERRLRELGHNDLAAWTDRSPHMLEAQHVRAYTYVAEKLGARMYIQHATTPETFEEIREARRRGVELYAQTGPAWLGFTPFDGYRINVPMRYQEVQEEIWKALARGDVDVVGSDHVVAWEPATREAMWSDNIWDCRTGFSRVETFLPVLLTKGVYEGRITLERLVQVSCENPARIYGLFPRKGAIQVGSDADLVVVDLSRDVTVGKEHLNTRAGWSIMEGRTYHGWPVMTLLRGRVVAEWADDAPGPRPVGEPGGHYLPRAVRPDVPPAPKDRLVRTGPDATLAGIRAGV
jgi:dihydropyrimidinase